MGCGCQITQLISVVFCVVTAVQKFDGTIVIIETAEKLRSVLKHKLRNAVTGTRVYDSNYVFADGRRDANIKGLYPRCARQMHYLD